MLELMCYSSAKSELNSNCCTFLSMKDNFHSNANLQKNAAIVLYPSNIPSTLHIFIDVASDLLKILVTTNKKHNKENDTSINKNIKKILIQKYLI